MSHPLRHAAKFENVRMLPWGPPEPVERVERAELAEQDRRFSGEIINAGVWGMTTTDEYHLLKDKLILLERDVVVLGLFMSNDINFRLTHARSNLRHENKDSTTEGPILGVAN